MFVFPQFYGDYYKRNAVSLWNAMVSMDLVVRGIPLRGHLEFMGITELGDPELKDPIPGTYLHHLKGVEDDFWNNRFQVEASRQTDRTYRAGTSSEYGCGNE